MSPIATPVGIQPHAGPQRDFLATPVDVAVYGGGTCAGKSYSLLLDPLHYVDVPGFNALILRREYHHIHTPGGLWDTAKALYTPLCAAYSGTRLEHFFPAGGSIMLGSLPTEKHAARWQGSQICFLGFDELQEFTERQFWHLFSRNRSMCGIKPYLRATVTADTDALWVKELLAWYIGPAGLPIVSRAGAIRFFARLHDQTIWGNTDMEVREAFREMEGGTIPVHEIIVKSFTFIPATIRDNPSAPPWTKAALMALPRPQRERLLDGNWLVRDTDTMPTRPALPISPTDIGPPIHRIIAPARHYVLVRTDLEIVQQIVQVGHACALAASRFGTTDHAHLVLLAVPDEAALLEADAAIRAKGHPTIVYHDPDEGGHTALCTALTPPSSGFARYPLWAAPTT